MSKFGSRGKKPDKKLNDSQIQGDWSSQANANKGNSSKNPTKLDNKKKVIHKVCKLGKLNCMYLNADTLTNKLSELKFLLKENKPDIVGISEVLPKILKMKFIPITSKWKGT